MNQENGRIASIIEAGQVNAYRTAAADAVAASVLARPESSKIAVFGAGHQALFECLALARIRPIDHISVIARDPAKGHSLAEKFKEHHLNATLASNAENACKEADIVVTATPSSAPLFASDWITPATHVSCMGADCKGKQEAPPALLSEALLFCDLPEQSRRIGEYQHADASKEIRAIGDVLAGETPGRTSHDDITVFDSPGISLQDLFIAQRLIDAAETQQ